MASTAQEITATTARPKGFKLLARALQTRKSATMLGLGFSSGLPFALLVGTLNAWLGEVGVNLATIGVLSWIGLSYSFKFLWSPLVDRLPLPRLDRLGRRKSWILLCQTVIVLAFAGLAATSPAQAIGSFALFAFLGGAGFGDAGHRHRRLAHRPGRRGQPDRIALGADPVRLSHRIDRRRGVALVLAARMSWPSVYLDHGSADRRCGACHAACAG